MLVALTKFEDELATMVEKAVLLTPCTITGTLTEPDLSRDSMEMATILRNELGIQAIQGPTWKKDLKTICDYVDNRKICRSFKRMNGEPMATKTNFHWEQGRLT